MKSLQKLFSQLKAPLGVYSTLGNHDYGDYASWPHEGVSKTQNLEDLKKVHAVMGWRLLMNEHVILKKGDDEIAVLGIENWGAKGRFPKYGKMQEAYHGTETVSYTHIDVYKRQVAPKAPYTRGSFQYFLLVICPQPGRMRERLTAILGSYFFTLSFAGCSGFIFFFCTLSGRRVISCARPGVARNSNIQSKEITIRISLQSHSVFPARRSVHLKNNIQTKYFLSLIHI